MTINNITKFHSAHLKLEATNAKNTNLNNTAVNNRSSIMISIFCGNLIFRGNFSTFEISNLLSYRAQKHSNEKIE